MRRSISCSTRRPAWPPPRSTVARRVPFHDGSLPAPAGVLRGSDERFVGAESSNTRQRLVVPEVQGIQRYVQPDCHGGDHHVLEVNSMAEIEAPKLAHGPAVVV